MGSDNVLQPAPPVAAAVPPGMHYTFDGVLAIVQPASAIDLEKVLTTGPNTTMLDIVCQAAFGGPGATDGYRMEVLLNGDVVHYQGAQKLNQFTVATPDDISDIPGHWTAMVAVAPTTLYTVTLRLTATAATPLNVLHRNVKVIEGVNEQFDILPPA